MMLSLEVLLQQPAVAKHHLQEDARRCLADDDIKLKCRAGILATTLDACEKEKESRAMYDLQGSLKRRGTFTIK